MGHLFWQPTPVPLNSPVPSQTLGQVWADPYYNNEVFSSSIMSTPFLLRWNIGWLGLFPPDSHLATPLHLTVMSHPRELLLLLYWAGKVFTWPLAYLPDAVAVADSWREVKKAELVENTNSRSRFLFHLVWRGHGKELPWGLGQWGSGQLATCGKKEGVLIVIYSYICIIYIKYQISISTSWWTSPWAVESAEKAARASPKLGGVAGVFDGVPQGRPAPPGLWFVSYPVTQFAGHWL